MLKLLEIMPKLQIAEVTNPMENHYLVSCQLQKRHVISISWVSEFTILSHDVGQQILCFDSCQLTISCTSYVKVNLIARRHA